MSPRIKKPRPMLQDIIDRLHLLDKQKLNNDYYFGGDTPKELVAKLKRWRDE